MTTLADIDRLADGLRAAFLCPSDPQMLAHPNDSSGDGSDDRDQELERGNHELAAAIHLYKLLDLPLDVPVLSDVISDHVVQLQQHGILLVKPAIDDLHIWPFMCIAH
jgi:hypothetical protein